MRARRLILPAVLLIAAYYAIFGGEYSYFEVRRARRAIAQEAADLAELSRRIDSLRAWADSLEVDPGTLEKLARERFGMIRSGEKLYRFVEGDSVSPPDSAESPGR
jgi:cell division protein FtsB